MKDRYDKLSVKKLDIKELDVILKRRVTAKDRQELKEYSSVQTWLEEVAYDSTSASDNSEINHSTEMHYLAYLCKFCWWINKNPDQIIKERLNDRKSPNTDVRKKYDKLVRRFSLGYKKQRKLVAHRESVVALKSFFRSNAASLNIKSPKKRTEKIQSVLSIEEIQRILDFCDVRERAIIHLLFQSGMIRPETLLQTIYGHIKNDFGASVFPVRVDFSIFEEKGWYAPCVAFICKESCEALEKYLESRRRGGEETTEKSPLIRQKYSFNGIGYGELRKIIKKVCQAAGIKKRVTPYTFRRTFQTIAEEHIPLNWVDRLMGHKPRGAQGEAYSHPWEKLRKKYIKLEPYISLSKPVDENSVKLEVLRGMAETIGVPLNGVLEKKKIKILDEMTDEDIEALYKEYRNAGDTKNCMNNNNFSSYGQRCPSCKSPGWKESDKFCGMCGTPLKMKCRKCGKENNENSNFCTQCGAKLAFKSSHEQKGGDK